MGNALAAMVALGLLGCSTGAGVGAAPGGRDAKSNAAREWTTLERGSDAHTLGVLQTRDERVTLMAARDGLRVTVRDAKGAIVAEDVTVDELRNTDPFLYEVCRSSVAANHYLDATLDRPVPPGQSFFTLGN